MGRFMRKFRGIGEISVMDVQHVGVCTRARALAMAAAAETSAPAKRRKISDGELESSSSSVQLDCCRQLPENLVQAGDSTTSNHLQYSNPNSDLFPTSCCSSNGSAEFSDEQQSLADHEEDDSETSTIEFGSRERREAMPENELRTEIGELESTARPWETAPRRQTTAKKMPSEVEVEEFFALAEKKIQKQFTDKYNYDIIKDEPLDGRYEWIRLKP